MISTAAGVEHWGSGDAGDLMTRECDPRWLIKTFADYGVRLERRVAGQFSESYVRASARGIQRAIHGWNRFWFSHVGMPGPAVGNIFVFKKDGSEPSRYQ